MRTIEPCCANRQFMLLRDAIGTNGSTQFRGYGDMSLTELFPALLTRYTETEMMIVAPTMPDQATEIISRWMRMQWGRMDGNGKLNVIKKLNIVADLSPDKSPMMSEWVNENPFEGRLVLFNSKQEDTAILMPDIAITGPLNLRYGKIFICSVTTIKEQVKGFWRHYLRLARKTNKMARKAASKRG